MIELSRYAVLCAKITPEKWPPPLCFERPQAALSFLKFYYFPHETLHWRASRGLSRGIFFLSARSSCGKYQVAKKYHNRPITGRHSSPRKHTREAAVPGVLRDHSNRYRIPPSQAFQNGVFTMLNFGSRPWSFLLSLWFSGKNFRFSHW